MRLITLTGKLVPRGILFYTHFPCLAHGKSDHIWKGYFYPQRSGGVRTTSTVYRPIFNSVKQIKTEIKPDPEYVQVNYMYEVDTT